MMFNGVLAATRLDARNVAPQADHGKIHHGLIPRELSSLSRPMASSMRCSSSPQTSG